VKRLAQGKYLAREGRKASEEADKAKISCALWVDQVYLVEVWGLLSTVDNPSCMEDGSNFSCLAHVEDHPMNEFYTVCSGRLCSGRGLAIFQTMKR